MANKTKTEKLLNILYPHENESLIQKIKRKQATLSQTARKILKRMTPSKNKPKGEPLESVKSDLYGDKVPGNFRNNLTEINNFLIDFLFEKGLEQNPSMRHYLFLYALAGRDDFSLFNLHYQRVKKEIEKVLPELSLSRFHFNWKMAELYYYSPVVVKRNKKPGSDYKAFKTFIEERDKYILFSELFLQLEMKQREIIFQESYQISSRPFFQDTKNLESWNKPELSLLELLRRLLDDKSYQSLDEVLGCIQLFMEKIIDKIDEETASKLSTQLLNRSKKILRSSPNMTRRQLQKSTFQMYEALHQNGMLMIEGKMELGHFFNYFAIGLDIGKGGDWAQGLIDNVPIVYDTNLLPSYYLLFEALIQFSSKNYSKTLEIIRSLEHKNEIGVIVKEQLLIRTYLAANVQDEKNYPLEDRVNAFTKFISRLKSISQNHKTPLLAFAKTALKVYHLSRIPLRVEKETQIDKFLHELNQSSGSLYFDWFRELLEQEKRPPSGSRSSSTKSSFESIEFNDLHH